MAPIDTVVDDSSNIWVQSAPYVLGAIASIGLILFIVKCVCCKKKDHYGQLSSSAMDERDATVPPPAAPEDDEKTAGQVEIVEETVKTAIEAPTQPSPATAKYNTAYWTLVPGKKAEDKKYVDLDKETRSTPTQTAFSSNSKTAQPPPHPRHWRPKVLRRRGKSKDSRKSKDRRRRSLSTAHSLSSSASKIQSPMVITAGDEMVHYYDEDGRKKVRYHMLPAHDPPQPQMAKVPQRHPDYQTLADLEPFREKRPAYDARTLAGLDTKIFSHSPPVPDKDKPSRTIVMKEKKSVSCRQETLYPPPSPAVFSKSYSKSLQSNDDD